MAAYLRLRARRRRALLSRRSLAVQQAKAVRGKPHQWFGRFPFRDGGSAFGKTSEEAFGRLWGARQLLTFEPCQIVRGSSLQRFGRLSLQLVHMEKKGFGH